MNEVLTRRYRRLLDEIKEAETRAVQNRASATAPGAPAPDSGTWESKNAHQEKTCFERARLQSCRKYPKRVAALAPEKAASTSKEPKTLPSLILVDGGLGQLHAAAEALESLGITTQPLASIAKKEEIIYVYGNEDEPVVLDRRSPVLHLIQLIRDESHRFAIGYHRQRRAMRDRDSELLTIPASANNQTAPANSLRQPPRGAASDRGVPGRRGSAQDRRGDLGAFPQEITC